MAFDPTTGDTFMVNDSGSRILKALQTGSSEEEVVGMLREEYPVTLEDAERDVTDFRGRLRTLGLT
jgi:hypothetical protein